MPQVGWLQGIVPGSFIVAEWSASVQSRGCVALRPRPALVASRRMPSGKYPMGPNDQGVGIIGQVNEGDCRPADRREADHSNTIVGPAEMLGPALEPGIEQDCLDARVRIACRRPIGLETVAQRTA